ncbi:MAG: GTP-binding protein [Acetobacteraceae bacterium]|nr:GTP-binding protein [Acetobacteraceae bacterium]
MSLFERDRSAERTPVSLITGFLGSGKTTLLNHLLGHPGMADSAVIVNEFGEIGLDHLLMAPVAGEVAVMANGCVCCTVRSDLEETLRGLLAARDAGTVPPFSRVLIETTGLADPAPIVQMLLNNPLVSHFARLDAVVTTVDAVHALRQLDRQPQAVKQVALADRLLLTKTDLAEAVVLLNQLRALNRAAPILTVLNGVVDPSDLFGAALFDPETKSVNARRWLSEDHEHDHAHEGADHAHGVASFNFRFEDPLEWDALSRWLTALRQARGEALLRVKGIVTLVGEDAPVAIHGVHHVFHPPVRLLDWPDGDRASRLVFITQGLDRAEAQAAAVECGLSETA